MRNISLALAALVLASPICAQDMPQTQPGRFHCQGAPGKNYNQEIVPLKVGEELRVAFRLVRENDGEPDHPPTASLLFHTPDGDSAVSVGQALGDRYQMYAAVFTPHTKQQLMFQYPITHNWIILKLDLDERGYLTVHSSDLTQRFIAGSTKTVASHLNCHSGEWEIDVWPRSYVLPEAAH
jgi:hypothetical protein